MTLFFMISAFIFGLAIWPAATPGTNLWWNTVFIIMTAAVSLAFFETKLNKIRDYLRMNHDHTHSKEHEDG